MDDYALTDDERAAGVGSLLDGTYERFYYTSDHGYPENHGKKWSSKDLNNISKLFKSGKTIDYIAKKQERTCYSIAWQLYEMDLISEKQREAVKKGLSNIEYKIRNSNGFASGTNKRSVTHKKKIKTESVSSEIDKIFDLPKNKKTKKGWKIIFENVESFFIIWFVVLLINQIVIFGACFQPYCIIAALPHTGLIAATITYFISE